MSEDTGVKSQARTDAATSRVESAAPARGDDAARGDVANDDLPRGDDDARGDVANDDLPCGDDAARSDVANDDLPCGDDAARGDVANDDLPRGDDAARGDVANDDLPRVDDAARGDVANDDLPRDDDDPHDVVFEALWSRAVEAWDDERPHVAILDHALKNQKLPELAGRYRSLKDDPEKGERAQKKLDGIVVAATQMLMATRTPQRTKTPWQWNAAAALTFAIVCAFLVYQLFVPHR